MALNPNTNPTMAGRTTAPDANYPYASSKDETGPGVGDGTPYFKARADDIFGFQQALLTLSSIVPSGNADTIVASQYAQSLVELASGRAFNYDETGVADVYVFDVQTNQHEPQSLYDGLIANAYVVNTNTGASTVDVAGLGPKSIKTPAGADPAAGDITANDYLELRFDLGNDWWVLTSLIDAGALNYILLRDEKASGVDGGGFTSGAWQTRDINTELFDTGGNASISANQITLDAGTYECVIVCPGFDVGRHQAKLYDTTGAADLILGSNENTAVLTATSSLVVGRFTLSVQSVLEIQHRCNTTRNTDGFGTNNNWGVEVYTFAELRKVG